MFVRNIDLALQRAEASYPRETWQMMSASERSAAIYRELRALDAQSVIDGSDVPPLPLGAEAAGAHRSLDRPDPARHLGCCWAPLVAWPAWSPVALDHAPSVHWFGTPLTVHNFV